MIKDKLEYYSLVKKMRQWQLAYDEGRPQISDEQWDEYYYAVLEFEKHSGIISSNSPTQVINYQVINKLKKVEHNHPMLSLQKTKNIEEVKSFVDGYNWIAMAKMDGLTCSLCYRGGQLVRAETRGNGIIGEDITHNARVISSIPKKISYTKEDEEVIIDGEVICTYENFEEFKENYANPRNFASGSIRLLDSHECAKRKLTFVAWDLIKGYDTEFIEKDNTLNNKLEILYVLGFNVVPWSVGEDLEKVVENIKDICRTMSYPIDGVVFKYNSCKEYAEAGSTDHHPKGGMAYKFYDELYETTLRGIEWQQGRTGVFTPIAIFDEVDTGESCVSRASLHNVSIMNQLLGRPFVGQKIRIFKANMIIPQVYDSEPSPEGESKLIIDTCPICGASLELKYNNEVLTLWCPNDECEGKLINKLEYFASKKGLDIKGISKVTLEKLIDWGWLNNAIDLFALKDYRQEWIKKEGFGVKSVDNILAAIEQAKSCTLAAFIASIGIPLVGESVAKDLANLFATYEDFRQAIKDKYDFLSISGFGVEKQKAILNFNYAEADMIYKYLIVTNKKPTENSKVLSGLTFVCTGKLNLLGPRAKLKELIESKGGKLADSVTSKTNYLINNDITSNSAKNTKAKQLGVLIITESQLLSMLS